MMEPGAVPAGEFRKLALGRLRGTRPGGITTALRGTRWTGTGRKCPRPRKPGPELSLGRQIKVSAAVERREARCVDRKTRPTPQGVDFWCASRRSAPLGLSEGRKEKAAMPGRQLLRAGGALAE